MHLNLNTEVTTHAWQQLLDLLLQLQGSLPGGIFQLLLLLLEHAESTQQPGEAAAVHASSEAAQLGRRQAAGLQTCLVVLPLLQSLVTAGLGRQTTPTEIARNLFTASVMWHHQEKGQAVLKADIRAGTHSSMYQAARPKVADLLEKLSDQGTATAEQDPALALLAPFWLPH